MITAKYAREALSYDPDSGVLTWLERPRHHFKTERAYRAINARFAGKTAGCKALNGYLLISLGGRFYWAHRLAFLIMTGRMPEQVDHADHDRLNNRWENLSAGKLGDNARNMRLFSTNTSGATGVTQHRRSGRWVAFAGHQNRRVHLGCFDSFDAAVAARKRANRRFGYHENHGMAA